MEASSRGEGGEEVSGQFNKKEMTGRKRVSEQGFNQIIRSFTALVFSL